MKFVPWPRKNEKKTAGRQQPGDDAGTQRQRRRFVREMVRVPIVVLDVNGVRLATGATIEVSEGGIRAHVNQVLPEAERVRVEMQLPTQGPITVGGTIRRAPGHSRPVVIQFDRNHAHQDALRQLVFAAQRANARR